MKKGVKLFVFFRFYNITNDKNNRSNMTKYVNNLKDNLPFEKKKETLTHHHTHTHIHTYTQCGKIKANIYEFL